MIYRVKVKLGDAAGNVRVPAVEAPSLLAAVAAAWELLQKRADVAARLPGAVSLEVTDLSAVGHGVRLAVGHRKGAAPDPLVAPAATPPAPTVAERVSGTKRRPARKR